MEIGTKPAHVSPRRAVNDDLCLRISVTVPADVVDRPVSEHPLGLRTGWWEGM